MLYSGIESMAGYGQRICFIPGTQLGPSQFFCWGGGGEKGRKGEVGESVKEVKERDRRRNVRVQRNRKRINSQRNS